MAAQVPTTHTVSSLKPSAAMSSAIDLISRENTGSQFPDIITNDGLRENDVDDTQPEEIHTLNNFPKLPPELRKMIWKHAANSLRNVDIQIRKPAGFLRTRQNPRYIFGINCRYYSTTSIPAILHTSRESRSEGLKYYTLDFGITKDTKILLPPRVYINWASDRLCVIAGDSAYCGIADLVKKIIDNKLKRIALEIACTIIDNEPPTQMRSGGLLGYFDQEERRWADEISECYLFTHECRSSQIDKTLELSQLSVDSRQNMLEKRKQILDVQPLVFRRPTEVSQCYETAKARVVVGRSHLVVFEGVIGPSR